MKNKEEKEKKESEKLFPNKKEGDIKKEEIKENGKDKNKLKTKTRKIVNFVKEEGLIKELSEERVVYIRDSEDDNSPVESFIPLNDSEEVYKQEFEVNYSSIYKDEATKDVITHLLSGYNYVRPKERNKKHEKMDIIARERLLKLKEDGTFGVERSSKGKIYDIIGAHNTNDKFTIQFEGDFIRPVSDDFKIMVHDEVKSLLNCNISIKSIKHKDGDYISGSFFLKPNISFLDTVSRSSGYDFEPHLNELNDIYLRC